MTDPETLTPQQRSEYIRQLQQTVRFWQQKAAEHLGMSREELIERYRQAAQNYPWPNSDVHFRQEFECEWIGDLP